MLLLLPSLASSDRAFLLAFPAVVVEDDEEEEEDFTDFVSAAFFRFCSGIYVILL